MKIVSWNVNGIRSIAEGVAATLQSFDADVVCFQETKVSREVLPADVAIVDGHNAYFSFNRTTKTGYSGVATYCKDTCKPVAAEQGLTDLTTDQLRASSVGWYAEDADDVDMKALDSEGRTVLTEFTLRHNDVDLSVCLLNVYCPRYDPDNEERLNFKMRFHRLLEARANALMEVGKNVIIVGDINIARSKQDHCDHASIADFDAAPHRLWFKNLLFDANSPWSEGRFVDVFRALHPDAEAAYTCWNTKLGCRVTNFGTRIDYVLADRRLFEMGVFVDCRHLTDVMGSDHCPVLVELNVQVCSSLKLPQMCTRLMPEFRGSQTKLSAFFSSGKRPADDDSCTVVVKRAAKSAVVQSSLTDFFDRSKDQAKTPPAKSPKTPKIAQPIVAAVYKPIVTSSGDSTAAWSSLFPGKKLPPPLCRKHKEPCVERTVKKAGPNKNKRFFCCARPEGPKSDPLARCDHFEWMADVVKKRTADRSVNVSVNDQM